MSATRQSYFEIVRGNVRDLTPKIVMRALVLSVRDSMQETLVANLYRESEFAYLLAESPEAVAAREKAHKQLEAVEKARRTLNLAVFRNFS